MKVIREYLSDFGKTYVQVELEDGSRVELAFSHDPDNKEIEKIVNELPKEVVVEEPITKITIDSAIAYLEIEFAKIKDQKILDAEKAKLDKLLTMTATEVAP